MKHINAADIAGAAIAAIVVLALAARLRRPCTAGQRLGGSLLLGAVLATVACIVMDKTRHAALASGHHLVAPELAIGWLVITAAAGLAVFILAAWRASARAARAKAAPARAGTVPVRGRRGVRAGYGR
jgi:hypothetical protein